MTASVSLSSATEPWRSPRRIDGRTNTSCSVSEHTKEYADMAATRKNTKSTVRFTVASNPTEIMGQSVTIHAVYDNTDAKVVFATTWAKKAAKRAAYLNGDSVTEAPASTSPSLATV